jgi:predicted HicB family RNase H-like nuclease
MSTQHTRLSEHVVIRMPAELRRQIEQAAEQEWRPLSNWVRCALADQLEQRAGEGAAA